MSHLQATDAVRATHRIEERISGLRRPAKRENRGKEQFARSTLRSGLRRWLPRLRGPVAFLLIWALIVWAVQGVALGQTS